MLNISHNGVKNLTSAESDEKKSELNNQNILLLFKILKSKV